MPTNKLSKGGPGGGHGSKVVVERPVKTGKGAKAAHLGGVSQLGNKVGDHVTHASGTGWRGDPLYAGRGYNPVPYGNEVAAKTTCGPGGSREVMKSGQQGTHGPVVPGNPPAQRKSFD
jgi:hypothetical protein